MEQRQGTIADIIFYNEDNSYTVAVLETEDEQLTVVGNIPRCRRGQAYILTGKFKTHPTYGEQFAFSEYEEIIPENEEGIEEFLKSGVLKGIGSKTAAAIVARFGEDSLDVIEHEPDRLVQVEGIGAKKAEIIAESFREHREFAEILMYFRKFGISAEYAMKLYKTYGSNTMEAVRDNPYRLVDDIFGIGFRKADSIAQKLGIAADDTYRVQCGISYVLTYYASEGHTFCPEKELCEKASDMLEISSQTIHDTLVEMAFEGDVFIDCLEERNLVYLRAYYIAEQNICKCIRALQTADLKPINTDIDSLINMSERDKGITLSENQRIAIRECLKAGVSIITGGPGTGKTTIINSIIEVLNESGLETAIAAPTGRAAKRITETSGYEASTIHRLLEYYYSENDDGMKFGKGAENQLEKDAIIIDEASMIDLMLMDGLVSAIKPGTRVIIVGDADQLPSVGAGNILRDMIESEYICAFKLTDIFRQAQESLIIVNAHKINHGEYPDYNEKGKEFFFMRQSSDVDNLELIKDLCSRRLPAYYSHCNPLRDIQVLTPVKKGTLGIYNMNKELQEVLNPLEDGKTQKNFGERIFRTGDKVMQIRNNYELEWKRLSDSVKGEGVFNGDTGFISEIDIEYGHLTVVFEDDKYVTYDFGQLDELELAYAITVHKSQGSEFPIVVMPITWFPPVLATRNLLYTAITRGKEAVVLTGSERRLEAMIDNNRIIARYSGLRARLHRFIAGGDMI